MILLAAPLFTLGEESRDVTSGWPPGRRRLHERFESFLASRAKEWPPSRLTLGPGGEIINGVPHAPELKSNLTLDFYELGRMRLSMVAGPQLFSQGREQLFAPGLYAVCLKSSSSVGYQHHFPIVWFEVQTSAEKSGDYATAPRLKIVPPPGDGEKIWPNQRIISFLDFHVVTGHRLPDAIHAKNELASPSVSLRVNEEGVVERDVLAEAAADAALHWRVYHDGRRVHASSPATATRLPPEKGPGSYLVMAGVESSAGFLPVSNILHFPLFPAEEEKLTMAPLDTDSDGTPDFAEALLKSEADQDAAGQLLRLWDAWQYKIKHRRIPPNSTDAP